MFYLKVYPKNKNKIYKTDFPISYNKKRFLNPNPSEATIGGKVCVSNFARQIAELTTREVAS